MATATDPNAQSGVAGLVGGIVQDAQTLVQQQFQLARVELSQEVTQAKQGAVYLGVAGALASVAVLLLANSLVQLLVEYAKLPQWLGYLIVGGVLAAAAGVFASFGFDQLGDVRLLPKRTARELQKTAEQVTTTATGG